jgi:hypothetical protein
VEKSTKNLTPQPLSLGEWGELKPLSLQERGFPDTVKIQVPNGSANCLYADHQTITYPTILKMLIYLSKVFPSPLQGEGCPEGGVR